jgi:23S rRNA pseudouridine1911/1915/1917 synthase
VCDDPLDTLAQTAAAITCVVGSGGERLDKWLAEQLPGHSRAEVQRWLAAGLVTAHERPLKPSYRVVTGDVIAVLVPPAEDYVVEPEPIPLAVVYEDADLLVVDKPAGMVVHPAAGNWRGTLVNAVLHHCPDLEGVGGLHRPGIVHRLDKDTSGLILVAKNDAAHRALQAQFKSRIVQKTYVALAHGWLRPEQGEIDAPIGRDPHHRQRMAVVPLSRGRAAVTRYEIRQHLEQKSNASRAAGVSAARFSLVACHPLTGRTHQIRVHLAHVGHPIAGDSLYGGARKSSLPCARQFLHAERIRFLLPASSQEVEYVAPLPADLQLTLAALQVAN